LRRSNKKTAKAQQEDLKAQLRVTQKFNCARSPTLVFAPATNAPTETAKAKQVASKAQLQHKLRKPDATQKYYITNTTSPTKKFSPAAQTKDKRMRKPKKKILTSPTKHSPYRVACTITVVEKRHLRSLAQQRKKFWPAKCRVFRVLLKDDPSEEPRRRGI
jgi:hypothetical protein